jgi:hypothetical protein
MSSVERGVHGVKTPVRLASSELARSAARASRLAPPNAKRTDMCTCFKVVLR